MEQTTPRWARALVAGLVRRPRRWIALLLALTAAASIFAGHWFRADNSAKVWLLEGDPVMVAYDDYLDQFGNDEVALIAVLAPDDVYRPELLEAIQRASDRIADHPKIARVGSITASTHIAGDAIEISVEPLLGDQPVTAEVAEQIRGKVAADPLLSRALVGGDDRVTLIAAQLAPVEEVMGQRPAILDDLRAIAAEELEGPDRTIHFGGIGVIYDAINRAVLRDTRLFISLSYLLILAGLWLLFRRLAWVFLALGIIAIATVITAGLFGALDRKINMVTSIVPTLILTVGVLDLIHLISARREVAADGAESALAAVAVPCVFNTGTDAIGFLALATAPMAGIRDFGLLSALGLLFLLATTLILAVPILARDRRPVAIAGSGWTTRAAVGLGGFGARHRGLVIAGGALIIGLGVVGASRIVVDTYNLEFLDADHQARRSHRAIEEAYGPYIPLEMTVTASERDRLKEPELLRALDRAERRLEADPRIQRVTGLPEVVTRLNEVVMDGDPAERRIPDSREAVAQQLLLYEGDPDAALDRLVDPHYRLARVTGRVKMGTAREMQQVIDDVEEAAAAELGDAAELRVAGYLSLYVTIVDSIAVAQVRSFALAFLLVALVLMLLLRSLRLGLIAMVPNLVPALSTLGLMGALGIRLDVGTVLVASLAIGVSVNDTTHLMFRFAGERRATPADPRGALERSLRGTGRAIFVSSIILMIGFAVLGFGSTNSIRLFGLLSAATVGFALIADLLLTPALLAAVYDRPSLSGSSSNLAR